MMMMFHVNRGIRIRREQKGFSIFWVCWNDIGNGGFGSAVHRYLGGSLKESCREVEMRTLKEFNDG